MIQLALGDCRSITKLGPPNFHVMIVDPPYSEHVHKSAVSQSSGRGVRERNLGFDHLSDDLRAWIAWASARVERWSVIYSDIESISDWRVACTAAGAKYIRAVPWVRWSMPQLSGDRPPSGCEMLSLFWGSQTGKKSWNGPGNLTHLDHKCLRGEDKHKAEKPLDQALDLVTWFSNPGEWIVDPTAGRATIGLACKLLGRNYLGIEINPEEHLRGLERLNRAELSERDAERFARWTESRARAEQDAVRREVNTAKVRERLTASG